MATTIPLHLERTNLYDLLNSSLTPLVEQAAELMIEIRVAALGEVPEVEVDREKIAWAVATLVGNALRYVRRKEGREETGGSVVVQIHGPENDAPSDRVSIAVHDDGPGIPAEKAVRLFERKEGAPHAAGLALSLVRDIVLAHGGGIDVESRLGEGTSITLQIPARS